MRVCQARACKTTNNNSHKSHRDSTRNQLLMRRRRLSTQAISGLSKTRNSKTRTVRVSIRICRISKLSTQGHIERRPTTPTRLKHIGKNQLKTLNHSNTLNRLNRRNNSKMIHNLKNNKTGPKCKKK